MARKTQEDPQLDMTPMIDVVFELIIFFVITIKQEDILSRLNVNRPAPATSAAQQTNDKPQEIEVGKAFNSFRRGVYVHDGREYNLETIDRVLRDIANINNESQIVLKCTLDSPHKALVDILDICYKYKLVNVNVFSM